MSKRTHGKELARARAKRAASQRARRRRIRVVAVVAIVALALGVFGLALVIGDDPAAPEVVDDPAAAAEPCDVEPVAPPSERADSYAGPPQMEIDPSASYTATLATTCGEITMELFPADAPLAVNGFVFLAREGYYADTPFHRVIDGFMVQGGDPTGTGSGGPGYTFADELELASERGYPRGTVAMANSGADTNGSQFFVVQQDATGLPADYTVFGEVTAGMDVVDRIAQGPTEGDLATTPVVIESVTIDEQEADPAPNGR